MHIRVHNAFGLRSCSIAVRRALAKTLDSTIHQARGPLPPSLGDAANHVCAIEYGDSPHHNETECSELRGRGDNKKFSETADQTASRAHMYMHNTISAAVLPSMRCSTSLPPSLEGYIATISQLAQLSDQGRINLFIFQALDRSA
jgi:hypothetical protein